MEAKNLRDFALDVSNLIVNRKELQECKVVASGDDEGNCFNDVCFDVQVGIMVNGRFMSENEANGIGGYENYEKVILIN